MHYDDARFASRPPIEEQLGIAIGYGGAGGYCVELRRRARSSAGWLAANVGPSQLQRKRR